VSISIETRKMVNYTWTWWSQVKTWWKLALCGTDVQIVTAWFMYRGERLIEPSSSWFPSKFPLGSLKLTKREVALYSLING